MKGNFKLLAQIVVVSTFLFLINKPLQAQCSANFNAGNDTTINCNISYTATATPGFYTYVWSTGDTAQSTTIPQPGTYYCSALQLSPVNLVCNGDFAMGDSCFYSDYNTPTPPNMLIYNTEYLINNDSYDANPTNFPHCYDHTLNTVNGNMMIVDGAGSSGQVVWRQAINVTPNTGYQFSFWAMNLLTFPPNLQVRINFLPIGSNFLLNDTIDCYWEQFTGLWFSGTATTAFIQIIDLNTSVFGNDFCLDDMRFSPICLYTDTFTVSPNTPTLTMPTNQSICLNDSLQLTATGTGNFSWSPSSSLSNPNINNPFASPQTNTTYTVTLTANGGCTDTGNVTVTVLPLPTPTIASNSPICEGSALNFNSTGGVAYSWTGPNGFNSNQQNPVINPATLNASGTYTVTVTDNNGCSDSVNTNVTVHPSPNVAAGYNNPLCSGDSLIFTSSGGVSYSWLGPNSYTSSQQNPVITNVSSADGGNYSVIVTDNNGCSDNASINVLVNPLPNATASSNSPLCTGDDIMLASGGGTGYSWSGPNGFNSNLHNPIITNAGTINSGNYTVQVSSDSGCVSSANTNVLISPPPNLVIGSNSPLCEGDNLLLTASGGATYNWTGPGAFATNQQNPSIPNVNTSWSGTYSVTATSTEGCAVSDSLIVVVNTLPVATASSNSPVCEGETLNLFSGGGMNYSWDGPSGFVSNQQNPTIVSPTSASSGVYIVTVTDANNCSNTALAAVNIFALPTAGFSVNTSEAIAGNAEIQFINQSYNANSYLWNFDDGNTSTDINPLHNYTDTGYYCVSLIATSGNGCVDSTIDCIRIKPALRVYIPNSFTPNADGLNDVFEVIANEGLRVEMFIFNRWGEEIYHAIESPWNGYSKNIGKRAPLGTYVYKVNVRNFDGVLHEYMGKINLLR